MNASLGLGGVNKFPDFKFLLNLTENPHSIFKVVGLCKENLKPIAPRILLVVLGYN